MITKPASKWARIGGHDPTAGQVLARAEMINSSHLLAIEILFLIPRKVFFCIFVLLLIYIFIVHTRCPVQLTNNHGSQGRGYLCKSAAAPPPRLSP